MVNSGIHSGQILSIENGIVTQKVNREGGTKLHDLRALSMPVEVGQVVDIKYAGGVGQVCRRAGSVRARRTAPDVKRRM